MSNDKPDHGLLVLNMTNFFSRELFLYSVGDIRLPVPLSIKSVGYFLAGVILWSVPLVLIFGFILEVYYVILLVAPPVGLAALASKPIFGGRGLLDAIRVLAKYIASPKLYTDGKASDIEKDPYREVSHDIWISRRQELYELSEGLEKKKRGK